MTKIGHVSTLTDKTVSTGYPGSMTEDTWPVLGVANKEGFLEKMS